MPMSGITQSSGGMMRRLMSVALIGLAVVGTTTVAAAQERSGQAAQAGRAGFRGATLDSGRARRIDSLRTARGDTAWRRAGSDSTRARGGRGRGGPPNARAALAGLNLTAAQKNDIKTINKKYADQVKQLRQANGKNGVGQTADGRAQMQAIAERGRAEIRGVLTPQQRTQFDANVAKHRGGKGKGFGSTQRKK
jgi:Spy/CpxP family protein refolding chaperone